MAAIEELKDYYRLGGQEIGNQKTIDKINSALEVKGAAAWLIRTAVKRNHDKQRKGSHLCPDALLSDLPVSLSKPYFDLSKG